MVDSSTDPAASIIRWTWFFKGGRYLKGILIFNLFSFEDKEPRITRVKPGLALRLLSKELFYIRAMYDKIHKPSNRVMVDSSTDPAASIIRWTWFLKGGRTT